MTPCPPCSSPRSRCTALRDPRSPACAAGFAIAYPPRVPLTEEDEVIKALRGVAAVIAGNEPYSAPGPGEPPGTADRLAVRRWPRPSQPGSRGATGYRGRDHARRQPRGGRRAYDRDAPGVDASIVRNDREVRRGQWLKTTLAPLRGKTLGIIGLGRIGRSVALRAASFRISLLGHDPHVDHTLARRTASN